MCAHALLAQKSFPPPPTSTRSCLSYAEYYCPTRFSGNLRSRLVIVVIILNHELSEKCIDFSMMVFFFCPLRTNFSIVKLHQKTHKVSHKIIKWKQMAQGVIFRLPHSRFWIRKKKRIGNFGIGSYFSHQGITILNLIKQEIFWAVHPKVLDLNYFIINYSMILVIRSTNTVDCLYLFFSFQNIQFPAIDSISSYTAVKSEQIPAKHNI